MTIKELIDYFAEHLKTFGLNGDDKQQELYKWEIISKYHDRLDADSSDFSRDCVAPGVDDLAAHIARERAAVCEVQAKAGVASHEYSTFEYLPVSVECRDVTRSTPSIVTNRDPNVVAVLVDE